MHGWCHLAHAGQIYQNASHPLYSGSFVKGEVMIFCFDLLICLKILWHSLSGKTRYTSVTDTFVVIQPRREISFYVFMGYCLCLGTQRFSSAASENINRDPVDLHNENTWLFAFLKSWFTHGGIWSSLCKTALHQILVRTMTHWLTPACLRNVQFLTYQIYVYSFL